MASPKAGFSGELSGPEKASKRAVLQFGSPSFAKAVKDEKAKRASGNASLDDDAPDPWPWVARYFTFLGMSSEIPEVKRNRKAFYKCDECAKTITAFSSTAQPLKKHHTRGHKRSTESWERLKKGNHFLLS